MTPSPQKDALARALEAFAAFHHEADNFPLTRLHILLVIAKRPGVTVKDIMEATGFTQSTVSHQVDQMMKFRKGRPGSGDGRETQVVQGLSWVIREKPVEDQRLTRHYLTPVGKAALQRFLSPLE